MYSTAGDDKEKGCLFVSRDNGKDSLSCGSSSSRPCKTLAQAILIVSDGGKICLDGNNTASNPYGCGPEINGTTDMKTLLVNKSIRMQSWPAKAHISCLLAFKSARNVTLHITLLNLVFNNSGIILHNVSCSKVEVTHCTFVNCKEAVGVEEQEEAKVCKTSSLVINDSKFLYNTKSVYAYLFNEIFLLMISRCVFQGEVGRYKKITRNIKPTGGAVYIRSAKNGDGTRVFAFISDSTFRDLAHKENDIALSFRFYNRYCKGNLNISNTTFLNNENSVFVFGGFDVRLTKVTINSTYGYAVTASGFPDDLTLRLGGIKVSMHQCILANNKFGIRMAIRYCSGDCVTSSKTLVVRNSVFLGGNETQGAYVGEAIRFQVKDETLLRPRYREAKLQLENVTFQGLSDCALYVGVQNNVRGLISVKSCKFLNNVESVYRLDEGSTIQMEFDEDPPKCSKQQWGSENKSNDTERYQIPVMFEDTIFENNVGISATLNFLNGNVTFKNCTFKNNQGLTVGGHVYMNAGYGRLNIINSRFSQARFNLISSGKQKRISSIGCFLHSESAGPIAIKNSSFTANATTEFRPIMAATRAHQIMADNNSTFRCPSGKQVKLDQKQGSFQFRKENNTCRMAVNYVKLFCEKCPHHFYSLQRGLLNGLDINKRTECLKCPYGASCANGKIKAKENFWGLTMATDPPSLQFFPCPLEYCSSAGHYNHYNYNACHGNRSGVLCGKCSDGFSEALYWTSCRKNEECNDHWFWLVTTIYVILFAVYFVFKPPVLSVLCKQTLWFKRIPKKANRKTLSQENEIDHDPGYLKIIFYFYQVAELVMINSPEKTLHMVPFIPPVIAVFNFQVKTLDGSIGCPFPGLSAVTKELFLCLKFLATMFCVGVIYAIHRAASTSRYIATPSLMLYLAVALEILLVGYETLADTTLKLMHCFPMEGDWRLFVDGNIQCWQWWQYLLIAFMVGFIVPLVFVLFWGSLMLANDKLSAKEFLMACTFPLPYLLAWIMRHCRKTADGSAFFKGDLDDAGEIKKVLHNPFREPSVDDSGTLYWESVLTGRRLILLTICTFVIDPTIRFICLDCASVLILIHHLTLRPFRDRKANILESLSLSSLVAICTFSLAEASNFSLGMEPSGPSRRLFHALQWIEIALLGLVPVAVCILVIFAALSQVFRTLYVLIKCLSHAITCKCLFGVQASGHFSISQEQLLYWEPDELDYVA